MKNRIKEISEELKLVISGKTFDALLPPLLFAIVNGRYQLAVASILAIALALLLGIFRLARKQPLRYAVGGLVGVVFASGIAYFSNNAANYYLPKIVTSALLVLAALVSLIMGKPMAALTSHLTRGWDLEWYWRKDVKPAYQEVTVLWFLFFLMRLALQVILFKRGDVVELAWTNTLLGLPFTIAGLILSYLYGIWRLHNLNGPSVEEHLKGKQQPWEGQTRGF
ncbi:uncharacterized protein DUF3159 [Trichococcus patagoniensis]|uniref:Uncharacterized protein DUF3159 n=1 Tax=Trichococcus patagoniensis TaxID=382641 RepID=A0A2T5IBG3_9LACT|nr:DUF3159 domain-containing protein [Trichococcus patagoniensis]PTQ81121.1 uncharacterized protein DUF3159 [Trichococcus patagoniensis]